MHIFYNETFDFRIVIKIEDFHIACEKLREYINDNKFGLHKLTINDFTYEDFVISDYHPDAPIKYPLNVG